ncbi:MULTISPECIES: hypothetical protein [Roseofilum]|uniref:Uncharacterized protein n=1 Tax=Roseofilum capinflatum BLCC-M114 TaxID=3022440 RepID=A0ABT7B4A6_9CYAN|nr:MULTISPECIES: hypothetical protein [Roseofilum]HBQ99651.1 hypothetical protein [Cyanobacteria bacterium UBA11691]MBP0010750.1 hypothetical protein [Roseofilum sp. Belize Diploria]MBP0035071.1 hypothetical protein [Roseofilum sp. Belize BBD 4]MBP0040532.1 hypothetical protein [Roseofilum sp. SBFL]MDJ1174013.1 hypothetical protein [Roseofilum capinflatum BLCC-M114]
MSLDMDFIEMSLGEQNKMNMALEEGLEELIDAAIIHCVIKGIDWLVDNTGIDPDIGNFIKKSTSFLGRLAKEIFCAV